MQLVERHCIDKQDSRYSAIDETAFRSKNLYNAALYVVRQAFIFEGKYLNYHEMDRRMQSHEAYKALPAKVSQQVLMQLHHDWEAFFKARAAYKEAPSKFRARPKIPGYKHKTEGRNLLVYTTQALSRGKKGLKRGIIKPSRLASEVKTKLREKDIKQVRIVPRKGFYQEESYTSQASLLDLDPLPVYDPNKSDEKHTFSGKRLTRGLYRAKDGRKINADINGSGNIIRKVAPDAFSEVEGVEDGKVVLASLVVHPVRLVIAPSRTQKGKS